MSHLFPLVKEIKSKSGILHFRRWRILETRWFNIYLHKFYKSDKDPFRHDHPWGFMNFILWGGYLEESLAGTNWRVAPHISIHSAEYSHRIAALDLLDKCAISLVVTTPRYREWGYHTDKGWMTNKEYRKTKNVSS